MNGTSDIEKLTAEVEKLKKKQTVLTRVAWLALGLSVGSLLAQYFFGLIEVPRHDTEPAGAPNSRRASREPVHCVNWTSY